MSKNKVIIFVLFLFIQGCLQLVNNSNTLLLKRHTSFYPNGNMELSYSYHSDSNGTRIIEGFHEHWNLDNSECILSSYENGILKSKKVVFVKKEYHTRGRLKSSYTYYNDILGKEVLHGEFVEIDASGNSGIRRVYIHGLLVGSGPILFNPKP